MSLFTKSQTTILFDLDGVLLQSGGYIAAMNATINFISNKLGLGNQAPDLSIHHLFEAQGISSEWDMTAICLAVIFERLAQETPNKNFPHSIQDVLDGKCLKFNIREKIEYAEVVGQLRPHLIYGKPPAESVFISERASKSTNFFPLLRGTHLFNELLKDSQDLDKNQITRLIQNHVIGDRLYKEIFKTNPIVKTEAFLETYDQVLISEENRNQIIDLHSRNEVNSCIFTARPSIPPEKCKVKGVYFCPEAEMGIKLVGLDRIPHIGFGNLQSCSISYGVSPFALLKPNPLQAITAIFSSLGMGGCEAIELAFRLLDIGGQSNLDEANPQKQIHEILPDKFTLVVFEDIVNGLRAVKKAGEIFLKMGFDVDTHYYGIAQEPSKAESLETFGAQVFPEINSAYHDFLQKRRE